MKSDQSHNALWTGIGIAALCGAAGLIYTELQAAHPSAALVTLLACGCILSLYATFAPFLGFPLPRTRTQPLWKGSPSQLAASASERKILFDLLLFLDGRRVLFDPMTLEEPTYVQESISQIRARLNDDLPRLGEFSAATPILLGMRQSCLDYLTHAPNAGAARATWPTAINDLRTGVHDSIEAIERAYGLSMPGGTGCPIRTVHAPLP
jgi:hypothetical protein